MSERELSREEVIEQVRLAGVLADKILDLMEEFATENPMNEGFIISTLMSVLGQVIAPMPLSRAAHYIDRIQTGVTGCVISALKQEAGHPNEIFEPDPTPTPIPRTPFKPRVV